MRSPGRYSDVLATWLLRSASSPRCTHPQLHNAPLHRRRLACLDLVPVCDVAVYAEEPLVSCVPHPVVPQPDVAQNDVNGRLVESVTIRVLFVSVLKCAELIAFWHETAGVLRTSHPPPQNVAENLTKDETTHTVPCKLLS